MRYRIDPESGRRLTTVELIVDRRDGPPVGDVWVRIGFGETELRQRIKDTGGAWDASKKLWRIKAASVRALGLQKRIVKISGNGNDGISIIRKVFPSLDTYCQLWRCEHAVTSS